MSDKNNVSVSEKMTQLSELVAWFDSDEFELEQALDKFNEAEKLAAEIESDLSSLKNNIDIIKTKFTESD